MKHKWIYYATTIVLVIVLVLLCLAMATPAHADELAEEPIWTNKMIALHKAADELRALGYSDDDPVIRALGDAWKSEYHDFCVVAKVIEGEAGGCEWDQMVYVGAVILNRVKSGIFHAADGSIADTVDEIVAAPQQYSTLYLTNFQTIQPRVWRAAKAAMDGDHDAPDDLYWQAEFVQGREVWKIFEYKSKWFESTTYFCRGTIYY